MKIGIFGGAGYTAGELLRILLHHPEAEIAFVQSNSQAGKPIAHIHTDLLGDTDLVFTGAISWEIEVAFLCMGHGASATFLQENPPPDHVQIIDLSQDFRQQGGGHGFVYGLPEWQKPAIRESRRIANPGCFATCIQLALLPLASAQALKSEVHVHAITGSTGAGQKPSPTTHFSWRNNNVSVYKAFQHQHLKEIYQSARALQPTFTEAVNFIPVRGNFARGIMASVYTDSDLTEAEAQSLFAEYYQTAPFVHLSETNPDLKQVVGTNKCLLHVEKHGKKLLIISMIDNLVKGASGQAVQNMNLVNQLPETTGLGLKGIGF